MICDHRNSEDSINFVLWHSLMRWSTGKDGCRRRPRVLRPQNIPGSGAEPCSFQMACGLKDNLMHFTVSSCSAFRKTLPVNLHLHPAAAGSALLGPSLFSFTQPALTLWPKLSAYMHAGIIAFGNSADGEGATAGRDTLMGKLQSGSGKI